MRRSGAAIKRLVLELLGWSLAVAGIAALFLPGPGLLMLLGGLVVLSQQYEWAERRVRPIEVAAMRAASEGVQSNLRIALSLLGVVWLWGTGLVWVIRPPVPGWWPVADRWWLFGGLASGVTLVASGFIALALIVYSIRRFRGSPYVPEEQQAARSARTSSSTGPDASVDA